MWCLRDPYTRDLGRLFGNCLYVCLYVVWNMFVWGGDKGWRDWAGRQRGEILGKGWGGRWVRVGLGLRKFSLIFVKY